MITHQLNFRALKDVTRLEFIDKRKVGKRKAKNRRPFDYGEKKHISTITVRTELKAFCVNVLGKVYNTLMKHCKDVVRLTILTLLWCATP